MSTARVGRPPICGACGDCPRCKHAAHARASYQRKTAEERRALVERRDKAKARAADRARYIRHRKKRRTAADAYARTRRGKTAHARAKRRWAKANPEKRRAHIAVGNALRDGRLIKQPCEHRGPDCRGRVHAHHDDYTRPLDVRWLCARHHMDEHHA